MSPTPTLHFLCGKLGAGKTTLARELALKHGAVLICEDIWLQRLFPVEIETFGDYLKYSERLKSVIAPHVQDLLSSGVSVVLDFPANTPDARLWIQSIFESSKANHLLHFIDASSETCISQMLKRNIERPEGSVETSVEQFEYITKFFKASGPEEGFNVKVYERS